IRRRVVVFPQPDGPSSEKNSPPTTSRLMPSTAVTSAKRLTRSTIWTWPPVMNQDLKRFANTPKPRVPGNGTLDQGAAIRAIPGKAEEGASLVGWRPTTTPPGAARAPRAQQFCCRVLLAWRLTSLVVDLDVTRPPRDDLRVPSTELEDPGGGRGVQYRVAGGGSRAAAGR